MIMIVRKIVLLTMQLRPMLGNVLDHDYDEEKNDDKNLKLTMRSSWDDDYDQHDDAPTSVETVHHSLISADGLVSVPHLRDDDNYDRDDDCDGEMNEDDDDEFNNE